MARSDNPNIILVLVDTLRSDHLSCYGHCRRTSPRLDALAEDATLYTNAISPGAWTPPSHASIFTGTFPSRHGVDRAHPYLDGKLTTLPEYLHDVGYRTYGISSNYWIGAATFFDRGFDVFSHSWQLVQARTNPSLERQRRRDPSYSGVSGPRTIDERLRAFINSLDAAFWRRCCRPVMAVDKGAARVTRTVRRWIRQWSQMEEPFFAFVHFMEPHLPYEPPARFRRRHLTGRLDERARSVNQNALKFITGRVSMSPDDFEALRRLYDAEISYTDHCIGEILDSLRDARLLDNSMFIVTSDHGENIGEHGLMDHMFSLHEPIVHAPLLVRYPGGDHRGIDGRLVQTHDIFPTIATLLNGGSNGASANGHQETLASQFQAGALPPFGPPRPFAVTELNQIQPPIPTLSRRYPDFGWQVYDRSLRAVRTLTEKLVRAGDGTEQFYAVQSDPGETTDLAVVEPQRANALRALLDDWEADIRPAEQTDDSRELDADLRRRLEDLGYLQE